MKNEAAKFNLAVACPSEKLRGECRSLLRVLTFRKTMKSGRRVSQSEVLLEALKLLERKII